MFIINFRHFGRFGTFHVSKLFNLFLDLLWENSENQEMNERVAQLRKHLGLTQKAFGERIGLTDAMVSMLESGKKKLQNRSISLICYTFGANEDWLRHGSGNMMLSKADVEDERQLLVMFGRLSDEMKQVVLRKVKELLAADEAWTVSFFETRESLADCAKVDTARPAIEQSRDGKIQ